MIIIRYLVRETLKKQIAILLILLLIFFCQNLVRALGDVVDGDIPINLVIFLLLLGVPKMVQLILPLSLFLSLLITFGRFYIDREITVMHACGLGNSTLIIATMILASLTSTVAAVNTFWANPITSSYQDIVINEAKANFSMAGLVEGKFKPLLDGNTVLFIGNVENNILNNIFLAQLRTKDIPHSFIVIAEHCNINLQKDGSQAVTLNKGTRLEGTALLHDFRITDFIDYQTVIPHREVATNKTHPEQMSINTLWHSTNIDARTEFHWRLTLLVSVVLMALLVVPLSVVNPRQGRALSMLPAIILYLIFFLLQTALRFNASKGALDPIIWLWGVNAIYFSIALVLNIWDTVLIRKFRAYLKGVA
ncbi:lipopolysaccharide export system permease protein [Serratia symbiotica str. 'Cinara cedri']|nr:lipopolysaccharide export system permease protein [Serratia symbiotica str. 'Cinara cedri']